MFSPSFKLYPLCAALLLVACASASKRFDQGMELETRGQYESAAARYAQALEKDPSHGEARVRLQEAGNTAIAERLADAEDWASRNDPVSAATQYHRADAMVTRARSVGVRLSVPEDYSERRRDSFDEAIGALLLAGDSASERGQWEQGLLAYRQARQDFEPTVEQRNDVLGAEADLLVGWSEDEYARGHLRRAFEVASTVHQLEWSPVEQAELASSIMDQALAAGEVELLVLPIQSQQKTQRERQRDLALIFEIDIALQQGAWRHSPAFVHVHDPLAARDLLQHTGLLDNEYQAATMALLLRLAEADFGARLELLSTESKEFDVRSTTRTVQKRSGQSTTFVQQDGKRRIQAEARVIIVDNFGNSIADLVVAGIGTAPFSRGVYDGKPEELNLSSREVDLFDRIAQKAQEQAAFQALAMDLSAKIAGAVYEPVLALIP
jgi:tetratricopeptide (TPR) repeat protein